MAKAIGQAYSQLEDYLYTWFEDGTCIRQVVVRYPSGNEACGWPEKLIPPPVHNPDDFHAFVPVNPIDLDCD